MKILSFNTGYFLGYEGSHMDYIRHPGRSITGSGGEKDNMERFVELVEEHQPEHVLVQEVDGGSLRTNTSGQHSYLDERMPERFDSSFSNKYRGVLYPRMPVLRYMGNSVFYSEGEAEDHSLHIGRKNLVQEIRVDGLSIFSLHLATLGQWVRRRQIDELASILEERESFVIAGDMNLHNGSREIDYLEKRLGETVYSPGETFPASDPSRKLDLVAASQDVRVENLRDLGNRFSDHRPIIFEVERG